jgi:hypothetical protein
MKVTFGLSPDKFTKLVREFMLDWWKTHPMTAKQKQLYIDLGGKLR